MLKTWILSFVGICLFLLIVAILLYQPVIRPWHARWGASDAEVGASLAGDEIVTGPVDQTTRAIDIHTPANQIWPWLMQIGQGRGGMFSYDALENLAGCDIHTLNKIFPELQNLKVGDNIKLGPQQGLPYYKVVLLEADKALVLRSINPATEEPGETWGFYLVPQTSSLTRLVIRHRTPPSQTQADRIFNGIFDPITFMMEHRMLYGLQEHAEKMTGMASH